MKAPFKDLLSEDLSPLGGAAAPALRFVLEGTDRDVLDRAFGLQVKLAVGSRAPDRRELFARLEPGDAAVLRRLGELYAAAGPPGRIVALHDARWLEALVWESSNLAHDLWARATSTLPLDLLDPDSARALLRLAVTLPGANSTALHSFRAAIAAAPGFGALLERESERVCEQLLGADAANREIGCRCLQAARVRTAPFVGVLAQLACGDARQARAAALSLLAQDASAARAELWRIVDDPKRVASERAQAIKAVASLGELDLPRTRALLDAAKGTFKKAIEAALAVAPPPASAPVTPPREARVPPVPPWLRTSLRAFAEAWHAQAPVRLAEHVKKGYRFAGRPPEPFADEALDAALALVGAPEPWAAMPPPLLAPLSRPPCGATPTELAGALAKGEPHPAHLARAWMLFFERASASALLIGFRMHRSLAKTPLDLLDFEVGARATGLGPGTMAELVLRGQLDDWGDALPRYVQAHPEILEAALGVRSIPGLGLAAYEQRHARLAALRLAGEIAPPPPSIVPSLWSFAFDGPKGERPLARKALSRVEGFQDRLLSALADKSQAVRAGAADWLAATKPAGAQAALRAALAKERKEPVRIALTEALEALGESLAALTDRDGLAARAAGTLASARCPALSWPEVEAAPGLHWDDGSEVPRDVARAWIAEAHKAKKPVASPLLRLYARDVRREDREAFARGLLEAWIAHDVARPGASAIDEKGVLAVVGAFGGQGVAEIVARYLKDYYGLRAAQCRALLQMLAWVEDRAAAQLLLATSSRFRTAGLRAEAERLAQELAERKGWSLGELADRTIPDAGLGDAGRLPLDFGGRRFVASIGPGPRLVVSDAEGGVLPALPEPRKGDDAARAAAAKAELKRAKKQLETVVKQQRDRLVEAMGSQRAWRFSDWSSLLAAHPIVRHLVVGIVWTAEHGDVRASFRPLGDGSLTTVSHDELSLPPDAAIRVAHPLTMPEGEAASWAAHLADFEIVQPIRQLGRPAYRLPADRRGAGELDDFLGHLVEAFKLRGKALGLGYARGPAEDGGWFYRYEKALSTLGLTVSLGFSGNGLPEENRTVALGAARFVPRAGGDPLPLGEVPPVLLSEVRADLAEIAATGGGFDPDWETKVGL